MKIFGSISELVDLAFRLAGGKQVKIRSNTQNTPGTVITVNVPDVGNGSGGTTGDTQSMVLTAAQQSLSNKTLSSPVVNSPIISGGSINQTSIGLDPLAGPAAGKFTTLAATSSATLQTLTVSNLDLGILHSNDDGVITSSKIVSSDLDPDAGIELSQLETIAQNQLLIGDATGEIVPVAPTANSQLEFSYQSPGAFNANIKDGAILNADINANADIAPSKIKAAINGLPMVSDKTTGVLRVNAGLTDDAVLVWDTDTGDFASIASVTSTELGYLDGVSSGIQGQLDGKASSGANSDITSLSNLTTALSGAQGGTGVANTNKTITLGGNLATSGNFTTTITSTNDTNVTLPTSGTLATLSGVETLTNKSLSHLKVPTNTGTISGGVLVLTNGTMVINGGENVLNSFNITSLAGFNNGSFITLINNEGADITISNNASIQTGTGEDYTLKNGATVSLVYSSTVGKWLLSGGAGAGSSAGASKEITQANSFAVGNVVYFNSATSLYALASNTAANTAEAIGVVSAASATKFTVTELGYMEGLSGRVAGEVYFLDASGGLTAVEPTTIGSVSKPMLIAVSDTAGFVLNYRGTVVGSANARTQISLSNNTTATVQNVSVYDAGELAGWVYIDATTDYRFYVQAQFAKNGAGNNYNLSYQTTGDTPPAGFSLSVTAAGLIQYTMPSVAGFASAVINYALNAPAVGTNFPLSIDGANVVTPISSLALGSDLTINGNLISWSDRTSIASLSHRDVLADRFLFGTSSGTSVFSLTRDTDTPDTSVNYSINLGVTTAQATPGIDNERHIRYAFEGNEINPYKNSTLSLVFFVKSNLTGTFSIAATNAGRDRTYITTYTINSANTWEEKVIQIPLAGGTGSGTWGFTEGTFGLGIRWALVVGSNFAGTVNTWNSGNFVGTSAQPNLGASTANYLKLAKVRVYAGAVPSALYFPRSLSETKNLVNRYYRTVKITVNGVNVAYGAGNALSSGANFELLMPVSMFTAPRIIFRGILNTDYGLHDPQTAANVVVTSFSSYERSLDIAKFSLDGSVTAGKLYTARLLTTSGYMVIDAELP